MPCRGGPVPAPDALARTSAPATHPQERADASHFTLSNQRVALAGSPPRDTMRRVASAGHLTSGGGGGGGMKRVASGTLRRPPSAGNLQTHSRNSGGSELFDALLQAATAGAQGEPVPPPPPLVVAQLLPLHEAAPAAVSS